jgi:hypothetical protein
MALVFRAGETGGDGTKTERSLIARTTDERRQEEAVLKAKTRALTRARRRCGAGGEPALDAEGEARFLATACSPVPEGCGCCAGG